MVSVIIGALLVAASIGFLLYCRPRGGQVMRAATLPLLETLIPLTVTSGLALGFAMIVAGILF
jgi:hypothetical protein